MQKFASYLPILIFAGLFWGVQVNSPDDYLHELHTEADFVRFQGRPPSEKYGDVRSVKVMWDLRQKKLYFISSADHKWHYDFARRRLGYFRSHYDFNARNYKPGTTGRDYILANLNYYASLGRYGLEFSSADASKPEVMTLLWSEVSEAVHFTNDIALVVNTERLRLAVGMAAFPANMSMLLPQDIYGEQRFQALVEGKTYGVLRRIPADELDKHLPGPSDIVVLDHSALDIPPVAGLICGEMQTPLSHLNVLCTNRKTPFCAMKGAFADSLLRSLEDSIVLFEVGPFGYRVTPARPERLAAQQKKAASRRKVDLKADLRPRGPIPMDQLSWRSADHVGSKAANFAWLQEQAARSRGDWKVPEGAFAIPFGDYVAHLQASGADTLIRLLLANPRRNEDPEALEAQLKGVRDRIKSHPVDPELLAQVEAMILEGGAGPRMRFRSSTNAEDIKEFNGAGLYDSKTGIVGDPDKTVERAIQKVWASAWKPGAYREREYFQLNQYQVAMGILVHRSFPDENANGVAVTANLYRKGYFGFTINVQVGETSVVSPPPGVECDQLICFADTRLQFFDGKRIIEYVNVNNQQEGPVMTEEQVFNLTNALHQLQRAFPGAMAGRTDDKGVVLDLEFKLDGPDNTLYIKQVRPFSR